VKLLEKLNLRIVKGAIKQTGLEKRVEKQIDK